MPSLRHALPQVVGQELAVFAGQRVSQPEATMAPCVQLRLVLRAGMFKIEHHPMEVR